MNRLLTAALLAPLLLAVPARAELAAGETCKLRKNVDAKLRNDTRGEMRTELERGTELLIEDIGRVVTRVQAGEVSALVDTELLEEACYVERDLCRLNAPVKMAVGVAGERKIFKVKAGAEVTILNRGPQRTNVQVGEMIGQMNTQHLKASCTKVNARPSVPSVAPGEPPLQVSAAPAGIKGAVLPFAIAKSVNPLEARMFEDQLGDALKSFRGDVMGTPKARRTDKTLQRDLKAHLEDSRNIATEMGLEYFITGHVSGGGPSFVLALSVVDVKTGKVKKGVKARPTLQPGDPWAQHAAGFLQEVLPGGKPYDPRKKTEAPVVDPTKNQQTRTASGGSYLDRPFYLNGLAWTALGTGAVLAGGGAASGIWASLDAQTYAATPNTTREELGNTAMVKAIVADSLYGAATVAVALSLLFFATGIDY